MKVSNAIIKSICGTALLSLLGGVSFESNTNDCVDSHHEDAYRTQDIFDSRDRVDVQPYKIKHLSSFSVIGMDPLKMRHRSHSSHRSHRSGRRGGCSRITEYDN